MSLRDQIAARIGLDGPISIAEYMSECLLHPHLGYYTTRNPFGAAGDFITAPDISQMFGELIGLCLAQAWVDQGRPPRVTLAELGPGRGALMADALRASRIVPGFLDALDVILVEVSPRLAAVQRQTLGSHPARWVTSAEALPEQPLLLVANEFFDALPIRQFIRSAAGWRERLVGVDAAGALSFGLGAPASQPVIAHRLEDTEDGNMVEIAPAAAGIVRSIGRRISDHGGAALIIDYGDWRSLGDTLQAVQAQGATDPLAFPGRADLTAHVDFEALASAAPCRYSRLTPQGIFLERLGIAQRAETLARDLAGSTLANHIAAHRRLTHPQEMGNLFKVLGFYPQDASPPPGLDP